MAPHSSLVSGSATSPQGLSLAISYWLALIVLIVLLVLLAFAARAASPSDCCGGAEAFCIAGAVESDGALVDCAAACDESCDAPLCEADCAFAEITGRNATSSTAASGSAARVQASRNIVVAEIPVGRRFDPHNFIIISVGRSTLRKR